MQALTQLLLRLPLLLLAAALPPPRQLPPLALPLQRSPTVPARTLCWRRRRCRRCHHCGPSSMPHHRMIVGHINPCVVRCGTATALLQHMQHAHHHCWHTYICMHVPLIGLRAKTAQTRPRTTIAHLAQPQNTALLWSGHAGYAQRVRLVTDICSCIQCQWLGTVCRCRFGA